LIPLHHLPGNAEYEHPRSIRVHVPTCRATSFDMREIPAGPSIVGGLGSPPAHFAASDLLLERVVGLPVFDIHRTEITTRAFEVFAELAPVHGIQGEDYPDALATGVGPDYPRGSLDWFDARAYCRFLGKELPTSEQWEKALRGGLVLPDGTPNPAPRRNVPW